MIVALRLYISVLVNRGVDGIPRNSGRYFAFSRQSHLDACSGLTAIPTYVPSTEAT